MTKTLQAEILERFLNKEQLEELMEGYANARMVERGRVSMRPTEQDHKIAMLLRTGKLPREIQEELKVSAYKIDQAARRVLAYGNK